MATYTIRQGNNLWHLLTGDISNVDETWTNWTGKWAIRKIVSKENPTADLVASGDLDRTEISGVFVRSIPPASTAVLEPGTYHLFTEVTNTARNYNDEDKPDTLIIQEQGIIPTP